jgi:iron complex outermembrane receptor protein
MRRLTVIAMMGFAPFAWGHADPTSDPNQAKDLASLGIEGLMKVEVTTVSKQAQSLSKVPAAVYVITQEQIRRSGATSIPELLRMVPGVQVQQIDASKWNVSIRGFGNRYSDKLLVLMDGRTVYTPDFSGVYWDAQDVDLNLIDRIEVIRGPGGTLWGANAVNGIINIITKSAKDTLGDIATVETSTATPYLLSASHGGSLADGAYRFYAKAYRNDALDIWNGDPGSDRWDGLRAGFRSDWDVKGNAFMLTADANSSHQGQTLSQPILTAPYSQIVTDTYTTSEFFILGKWDRKEGADKDSALRLSFDHYNRDIPEAGMTRNTFDADYQRPLQLGQRNHLIWGLGYNLTDDRLLTGLMNVLVNPVEQTDIVYSGFIQDEASLNRKTELSLGTKVEHNDYTGWDVQPSARLRYSADEKTTWWAAVSRAVHVPSRGDEDTQAVLAVAPPTQGLPIELMLVGNTDLLPQEVISGEIGWRHDANDRWFVDVATFYNHYRNLRGAQMQTPTVDISGIPHVVEDLLEGNGYSANTAGIELSAHLKAADHWSLDGAYSLYSEQFTLTDPTESGLGASGAGEDETAHHQFSLRSQLNLPKKFEFDSSLNYVSNIASGIPAYARVDLRLGWRPTDHTDFSLGVTNLTNQYHIESAPTFNDVPSLIQRSFYARATFHF